MSQSWKKKNRHYVSSSVSKDTSKWSVLLNLLIREIFTSQSDWDVASDERRWSRVGDWTSLEVTVEESRERRCTKEPAYGVDRFADGKAEQAARRINPDRKEIP